jgi:molybdenum cofactor cytidylyltransferase
MTQHIGAVVLAAGLSSRMGRSKALLPWRENQTVIEQILAQLQQTSAAHILVVTGQDAAEVAARARALGVGSVYNPAYATGEMLSSLQAGLAALPENTTAALVVLGDQPRLEVAIVERILAAYAGGLGEIVAPRYGGQRGHPLLISRRYWGEMLALPPGGAPRDVIQRHPDALYILDVESDSVVTDIDTPEDYALERRRAGLDS